MVTTHRKVISYQYVKGEGDSTDDKGSGGHGTHCAGTVSGHQPGTSWNADNGLARDGKLVFFDIGSARGLRVPGDMESQYYGWGYRAEARVSSNSWGGGFMPGSYAHTKYGRLQTHGYGHICCYTDI